MNQNSPQPADAPPAGFFASIRRIGVWRTDDRWVGGVAAGVAHRMGIDPVIIRGLVIITALFGGVGLILYGAAWALLPEASDGRIHLEEAVRGRFDIAIVGAAAIFLTGVSNPVFWWDGSVGWRLSWFVAVAAVVGVVVLVLSQRRPAGPPSSPPFGTPPPAPRTPENPMTTTDTTVAAGTDRHAHTDPTAPVTAAQLRLDDLAQPHAGDLAQPRAAAVAERQDVTDATAVTTPLLLAGSTTETAPLPGSPAEDAGTPDGGGTGAPDETGTPSGDADTPSYNVGGPGPATAGSWDDGSSDSGRGSGGWGSDGWGSGGSGSGGSGGGWGGGRADSAQPAPAPVRVVPGPGARLTSAVLAVSLLAAAGLTLANHTGVLDANPWLLVGGTVLTVLGAGVVLSGVLGRRQGGIGVLGLFVALVLVPSAVIAATVPGLTRIGADGWRVIGDDHFAPTTIASAEAGRSVAAGSLLVDLTELDLDTTDDLSIAVEVGFGSTRVIVPDDVGVTINAEIGAGELVGPHDDEWTVQHADTGLTSRSNGDTTAGGLGVDASLSRPGTPHITIEAEVGFGQIVIEEQS